MSRASTMFCRMSGWSGPCRLTLCLPERSSVNRALGSAGKWRLQCVCSNNSLWLSPGDFPWSRLHSGGEGHSIYSLSQGHLTRASRGLALPGLGLLTAWWPRGRWSYLVALACKGKRPHGLGRSCITFHDSALEITQHHFCRRSGRSLAQIRAEAESRRMLRFRCGRAIGVRVVTTAIFRKENVTSRTAYV